jgi:hypothetical protein
MKQDASKDFKNAVDKAFTTQPNVKLNSSTMKDAMALKQSFKEQQELEGGVGDEMTLKKLSKKHGVSLWELVSQFDMGVEVEREHTNDLKKAMEIAIDHLTEDPKYYKKLNSIEKTKEPKMTAKKQFSKDLQLDKDFLDFKKRAKYKQGYRDFNFGTPNVTVDDPFINKRKWSRPGKEEAFEATGSGSSGAFSGPIAFKDSEFLRNSFKETPKLKEGLATNAMDLHGVEKAETKEATGSGSVGGYESPSMWAKSTKKKDWGPSRKTQVPGGSFVKVKKKCTKFPYCNQGDINALILSKNESVKEAVRSISKKYNIGENVIISILEQEYSKLNKRAK